MRELFAQSALAKVLALVLLTLLLALPLSQIGGLIHERGASRERAAQELAASHSGRQVLIGPVLLVPYVERWTEEQRGDKGELKARIAHCKHRTNIVFPTQTDLKGRLTPHGFVVDPNGVVAKCPSKYEEEKNRKPKAFGT